MELAVFSGKELNGGVELETSGAGALDIFSGTVEVELPGGADSKLLVIGDWLPEITGNWLLLPHSPGSVLTSPFSTNKQ